MTGHGGQRQGEQSNIQVKNQQGVEWLEEQGRGEIKEQIQVKNLMIH